MKTFKTACLTKILVSALMIVTPALAQDEAVSPQRLDQVLDQIAKNGHEMAQLMQKYGPSHPEVRKVKRQHDLLHAELAELAELDPHGALEHPNLSLQLRQTMQRFADTLDQLSSQLEAIEKLGNQIGVENLDSRKAFFESSETMFLAAKKHFSELENLLGTKPLDGVERDNPDHSSSILSQARQVTEHQKRQALAMQAAALDTYTRALQNADEAESREQRLDQFDERLLRIEKLLERLLEKEGSSETPESDR